MRRLFFSLSLSTWFGGIYNGKSFMKIKGTFITDAAFILSCRNVIEIWTLFLLFNPRRSRRQAASTTRWCIMNTRLRTGGEAPFRINEMRSWLKRSLLLTENINHENLLRYFVYEASVHLTLDALLGSRRNTWEKCTSVSARRWRKNWGSLLVIFLSIA